MSTPTTLRDRRGEPRRYCCAKRLSWRTTCGSGGGCGACAAGVSHGWLNDVSESGLGFLTHRVICPGVGDEIEVLCDDERAVCRVLHVRPADATFSLVGCRRISSEHEGLLEPPEPCVYSHRNTGDRPADRMPNDELCPAA